MAERNTEFDVVIIGGGPAGLSTLLWCADLRLKAMLIEKEAEFGGQLLSIHNRIQNYLGVDAANGRELRDLFLRQFENTEVNRLTGAHIIGADLAIKSVTLADGAEYVSRTIVIATGVMRRKLMVPGEDEFQGRGILRSGVTAKDDVRGKTVVIVGGGDAALENAVLLADTARSVTVVHRRSELAAREEFVVKARNTKNIEFSLDTQITQISGKNRVESVGVKHLATGESSQIKADAVLIRIGARPNTEPFRAQIALDDAGYVVIDANCATSLPGIFAVGDVANPIAPTIAAATGQGSIAAKAIFKQLTT